VKWCTWNIAVNGVENLTLRKADQKCLESFQTWCWRKMEKMRTTNRVIPYRSCPKRRKEITTICCVITQKSAVFIYFAVEAWKHALRRSVNRSCEKFKVLYRAEEERNILPKIDTREANWIGHILCRNHLLKHFIEGKRGWGGGKGQK
jgi:hypothetical protein